MLEYGAIWTTLKMPDKDGKSVDISCGFDDIKGRLGDLVVEWGRGWYGSGATGD